MHLKEENVFRIDLISAIILYFTYIRSKLAETNRIIQHNSVEFNHQEENKSKELNIGLVVIQLKNKLQSFTVGLAIRIN